MPVSTIALFNEDAYLKSTPATVVGISGDGAIILDQTVFYANSGGQPGDTGYFERSDGTQIKIANTITGVTKNDILHLPEEGQPLPSIGEKLIAHIDWERRYALMRMHTACHLLSVVCPYPITGAAVNLDDSRVDFDLPDTDLTKELVSEKLMELVNASAPISINWITDEELIASPELVKSKNVRPPIGLGRIRLVAIGENGAIDSQPCGGTHVANTAEVGQIYIGKIEKKGRENRRFRIRFGATA